MVIETDTTHVDIQTPTRVSRVRVARIFRQMTEGGEWVCSINEEDPVLMENEFVYGTCEIVYRGQTNLAESTFMCGEVDIDQVYLTDWIMAWLLDRIPSKSKRFVVRCMIDTNNIVAVYNLGDADAIELTSSMAREFNMECRLSESPE